MQNHRLLSPFQNNSMISPRHFPIFPGHFRNFRTFPVLEHILLIFPGFQDVWEPRFYAAIRSKNPLPAPFIEKGPREQSLYSGKYIWIPFGPPKTEFCIKKVINHGPEKHMANCQLDMQCVHGMAENKTLLTNLAHLGSTMANQMCINLIKI